MTGTFNRQLGKRRTLILATAREWLGTPFKHQARVKGVGVDCAGLAIEVGLGAGVLTMDGPAWEQYRNYARLPNPRMMGAALGTFARLHEGEPLPGDICWLEWRSGLPMHLAILGVDAAGQPTLIHALESAGRVVEHGFTAEWPARVVSWWRFPGLVK